MNSYQRVLSVLNGEKADCCPVVPMVREWCCVQAGYTLMEAFEKMEIHHKSQEQCQREFGYDILWGECYACHSESEAMGSKLKIAEGMPPSVIEPAVQDYEKDLYKLALFDPYQHPRLSMLLNSIRSMKEKFAGQIPVMGYVQAPFRHASMLRGSENIMKDMYKNKESLKTLCELALYSQIVYAVAVMSAGPDIVFLSDPTSSGDAISSNSWKQWGLPYTKTLVDIIKRKGMKTILHICGDTTDRLESLAETGVDCLSLDMAVDFEKAREILGPDYCLMGNIDTSLMAFGKPSEVEAAAKMIIYKAGKDGALLLSGGCLLPEICPPENIEAMVQAGHKHLY